MKPATVAWILAPLSAVALAASLYLSRAAEARSPEGVYWDDYEFQFVRDRLADTYVDDVSDAQSKTLFNSAVDGYLKALPDEYNDFIPSEEYRKWQDDTAGHYAGVGVKIDPKPGEGLQVTGVFPGGPAAQAGVQIGEVITHVDGVPLANLDLTKPENVRRLKGPIGSQVTVLLKQPAPAPGKDAAAKDAPAKDAPVGAAPIAAAPPRRVTITRGTIRPPSVFSKRVGKDQKVGYIRIEEFVEATIADFDAALDALVAVGVKSIVLDLRENGGGVLPATVHVADRFVREWSIVMMRGRAKGATRTEVAHEVGTIDDSIGLVVLVDGKSASASEVLAGCLQDHRRGVLLGTRTFGKFLVQNITEIPGRDAAVKITTARYMTPNGRSYARDPKHPDISAGLIPDVVVEMTADDKERLEKSFVNAEEAVWGAKPRYPEVAADWVDPQLQKALDLIAGNLLLQEIRGGPKEPPKNG